MTKHQRTGPDLALFAIVLIPLLTLVAMFTASLLKWQSEQTKLDESMESIVGKDATIDHSTLASLYEQQTSDESTATWKAVLSATEAHNSNFGGPFAWSRDDDDSFDNLVPPGQQWALAEIMARYGNEAEPILAQIETLLDSDDTIWLPIVFSGVHTYLTEAQQSRGVARLLHYSFLDAIHQSENARAIKMLQASDRLFGHGYKATMLVDKLVQIACHSVMLGDVRMSMAANVWTDTELREIESIVSKSRDWDAEWTQTIESEMYMMLPELIQEDGSWFGMHSGMANIPFHFAPSTLRSLVETQHRIATMRGAGTSKHVERAEEISNARFGESQKVTIDQWLQMPTLNSQWIEGMIAPAYQSVAHAFRRAANEQRFTRTIVSLREYRMQFGNWPSSLKQLVEVGLPKSETIAFDGGPFQYEIEGDDAVIYDQSNGSVKYTDVGKDADRVVLSVTE